MKRCPNCRSAKLRRYDKKCYACDKCYLYFERGFWWTVNCDEYHAHSKKCLRKY